MGGWRLASRRQSVLLLRFRRELGISGCLLTSLPSQALACLLPFWPNPLALPHSLCMLSHPPCCRLSPQGPVLQEEVATHSGIVIPTNMEAAWVQPDGRRWVYAKMSVAKVTAEV